MTQFGLGRHVWMLPNPEVEVPLYLRVRDPSLTHPIYPATDSLQSFYVSIVLYCAGLFTVKMTFLFQYYRVFGVQKLRKVFIGAIVVVGASGVSQVLIGIFICTPVRGFWDASARASCVHNYPQFYINAAGNIATDLAVLVLPFPPLRRLALPRQQRLLLFAIFGLGFFTVAVSVLRIKYLRLLADFTWQNVETSAWSLGELCSGITCACLPTLRPFLKAHFPALGTRLTGADAAYAGHDLRETAATAAAAHKRVGSGDSSQPSLDGRVGGGAGPAYMRYSRVGGGFTEDIGGLQAAGHWSVRGSDNAGEEDREARLGLRMTVLSRVDAGITRPHAAVPSGGGIRVERAVYQAEQQRGA